MAKHLDTGQKGENRAVDYLLAHDFHILERNWRIGRLEIDIIAIKNNIIHFVEVKTRTSQAIVSTRETLTHKKKENLEKLVELWYLNHPQAQNLAQLDFIAITVHPKGDYTLEYYPNYSAQ